MLQKKLDSLRHICISMNSKVHVAMKCFLNEHPFVKWFYPTPLHTLSREGFRILFQNRYKGLKILGICLVSLFLKTIEKELFLLECILWNSSIRIWSKIWAVIYHMENHSAFYLCRKSEIAKLRIPSTFDNQRHRNV